MIVAVALIVSLIVIFIIKEMKKPRNLPPGPPWFPFVGNVLKLKKLAKTLKGQEHAFLELSKQYKSDAISLKLGNELVVVMHSYEQIREVLTKEEYEARPTNYFLKLRCLGKIKGITGTAGQEWNNQRTVVNRHLRQMGFGKKEMDEMVHDELGEILDILNTEDHIIVKKLFAPAVLNVIWTFTTSKRIPRSDKRLNEILDLFGQRSKAFDMTGGILCQYPWLRFIAPKWSGYSLIQDINGKLRDIFLIAINEHYDTWEEGKDDDLIYRYISEIKNSQDPNKYNNDHLIVICFDLFLAGATTISAALDFLFLMMVMYPEIQKKIHEDIDRNIDKNISVTYSDRTKVPYVEAVILETIRHRYVMPVMGPRKVLKNTKIGRFNLPKGTTVFANFYALFNNPEYWSKPELFMPERFIDKTGGYIPNEKVISFGLGRRRCLGEILAKTSIFIFFVEIMKNYAVSIPNGYEQPTGKYLPGIIISPEKYVVTFTKRC